MSASLRQFNVTYVETEDRLLLKVSTSDNKEYRLWCTRRYTRLLFEQLEGMFEEEVDAEQLVPAQARQEVARFKHSEEVDEASFQKPYAAEAESFPLGEEGLLATTLRYKKLDNGVIAMTFCNADNKGLSFNLNRALRHQLFELLSRAAQRARWFDEARPVGTASLH